MKNDEMREAHHKDSKESIVFEKMIGIMGRNAKYG